MNSNRGTTTKKRTSTLTKKKDSSRDCECGFFLFFFGLLRWTGMDPLLSERGIEILGCFRSEGKFLYSLAPADPDVLQFWSKKACSEISLEGWRGAKKFPRKCNKGKSLRRPFLETFSGDKPCFSGDNSSDIDALKRGFWRHFLETISFTWRHFPFLATFLATFPLSETLY